MSHPIVEARLGPMIGDGVVATCALVDLEVLYSARSLRDFERILDERRGFEDVPLTPEVFEAARNLQHALARRGAHRLPLPDLIISAAAASEKLDGSPLRLRLRATRECRWRRP